MDLLLYVLTVALWLAFAWVTACIYLTVRYNDDGKKYVIYRCNVEGSNVYGPLQEVRRVRFPTAYLIIDATQTTLSTCMWTDEQQLVVVRTSNEKALVVACEGPLKHALSRKYDL